MKARLAEVSRVFSRLRISIATIPAKPARTHVRRFSLADRIKQFIPIEALEPPPKRSQVLLAPHATELSQCTSALNEFDFALAAQHLSALPLGPLISATRVLADKLGSGPLGEAGIVQLLFAIYEHSGMPLVQQILPEIELSFDVSWFTLIGRLPQTAPQMELDDLLQLSEYRFPSILSSNVSGWLKIQLLSHTDVIDYKRWLIRYASSLTSTDIALLLVLCPSKTHLAVLSELLHTNIDFFRGFPSVLAAVRTRSQFREVCMPLISQKQHPFRLDPEAYAVNVYAPAMLRLALKLGLSYDAAMVCSEFPAAFKTAESHSLLAEALIEAAFAQKNDNTTAQPTFLVRKILFPLANDGYGFSACVGKAAAYLNSKYPKTVPGPIFWQLCLSLPSDPPLQYHAERPLAKLVVKRPYVEQLRYMALPITGVRGIVEVLRMHTAKIMGFRSALMVPCHVPQAEADIQFFVAGMIVATEKSQGQTELIDEIAKVFTTNPEEPLEQPANHNQNQASSDILLKTKPDHLSRNISARVLGQLVKHDSFAVAIQLAIALGPQNVPYYAINSLLLALAQKQPNLTNMLIRRLVADGRWNLRWYTLNGVLLKLASSPQLTDAQLMNQFQRLMKVMREQLGLQVNAEAASALVDAFLQHAEQHGGSWNRLQWAVSVARNARVGEATVTSWHARLETMQAARRGYWA